MPEKVALVAAVKALAAALELSLVHAVSDKPSETGSDNVADPVDSNKEMTQNPDTVSQVRVLGMTAEEFRQLRAASGYTQEEAARALGVATRTVTRWEAGRSRIDSWKAQDIRFKLRAGIKEWELRRARLLDRMSGKSDKVSRSDMPTESPDIPRKPSWVKELDDV